MFSFSHVYPTSLYKEGKKPRNVRTRILGIVQTNQVLYLVMTSNSTEILLVDKNGKSTTVLSFKRYVEIICADISSDFDLLIYTERIPNGTKFSFRSNMYHLRSLSDIKAFEDNSPITSFFLPDVIDNSSSTAIKKEYLFLNIIGNSITHFRATFANKKLQIKHERMGVNLTNCRSFFYDNVSKNNRLVCAITRNNTAYFFNFSQTRYFYKTDIKLTSYETINFSNYDILNLSKITNSSNSSHKNSVGFSIFNFSKDKNKDNGKDKTNDISFSTTITPEASIRLMNKYTILPPELALLPSVPTNNPFFRFSSGNMHVVRLFPLSSFPNSKQGPNKDAIEAYSSSSASSPFCKDFAIIEQLYRGEEFPLAFSVTVVEKNYSRLIEVPNVQSDVPINFLNFDNLVFIYVLNSFVSMIDFAIFPPSIFFLPRSLCHGPKNETNGQSNCCDISTTTGKFTVDLESGEIYNIIVDLKDIRDDFNLNFSDRNLLKILATLIARLPSNVSISGIISKLPINKVSTLIFFFRVLFQIGLVMDLNLRPKTNNNSSNNDNNSSSGQQQSQKTMKTPPVRKSSISQLNQSEPKKQTRQSSYVLNAPDHITSSLSSSSSTSGGSISLVSFDEFARNQNKDYFGIRGSSQGQMPAQNQINRTHSSSSSNIINNNNKQRSKHYGRTIHDLSDMRPHLSKDQLLMLEEMNKEFPSLGKYTRIDSFLYVLVQLKSLNLNERAGPDMALWHLQLQNRLSLVIRAGLDEWLKIYSPNEARRFILCTALLSEARKSSAPLISCLEPEVEELADLICSQTLKSHFRCSAKLFGISRNESNVTNSNEHHFISRNKNNSSSIGSPSNSTNSIGPIPPIQRSSTLNRRKTLTGSVTIFLSNRPTRKRNSLSALQISISTKKIQLGKMNSSLNFFRKLKLIELKNKDKKVKSTNNYKESFDPHDFYKAMKNREELELNYWSSRLSTKNKAYNESDSESSNFGNNSVAMSKLSESQWSRADSVFDSDGTSPDV